MTVSLQTLKVIDFSRVLAGPLCAMILGDLGANVIKVERPGSGDHTRDWGPPFGPGGASAYFLSINRNKLSIALDLDSEPDRDVLRRLLADADVLVENFLPGALGRRGFEPTAMLRRHRRLIWCRISGFSGDGQRPGYDFVTQAESGWMSITGEPDGEPMKAGVAIADLLAGKDATIAILAAVCARSIAGDLPPEDRLLSISLQHSATAALVNVAQNVLMGGGDAVRWGNAHANLVPYQMFRASDRHLVIAVGSDAQWRGLCRALELPELAGDRRLETNAGRLTHRAHVVEVIGARVAQGPASRWLGALTAEGVPGGVVRSVRESLDEVDASPLTGVAPARPGRVRRPPPALNEHGALIRERLWSAFEATG